MFNKKTVRDIDLAGKHVLLRADYNVPVENGQINDDFRIKQSLPTIEYILGQKPSALIIISHLGRPEGQNNQEYSLQPVVKKLNELLGQEVQFVSDCVGESAKKAADGLPAGGILVLENVRFHPEEEKNDKAFAKKIAEDSGAQVFVQDGFGVVHRAHATTDALARLMPSVAGFLLEKEVSTINRVMKESARPLVAVIGGAKISDKIDLLNRFIDMADCVVVVGAMANNFLLAEDVPVGISLVEPEVIDTTREILRRARRLEVERNFNFIMPVDSVVSTSLDGRAPTRIVDFAAHMIADVEAYPKKPSVSAYTIGKNESVLDIGPVSAGRIAGIVGMSQTVIWNGTCGVTEVKGLAGAHDPFSHGTRLVVDAMIGNSRRHKNKPFTLVGGGDTAAYVASQNLLNDFDHVSTGGGASLELLAGKPLPGVDVLQGK